MKEVRFKTCIINRFGNKIKDSQGHNLFIPGKTKIHPRLLLKKKGKNIFKGRFIATIVDIYENQQHIRRHIFLLGYVPRWIEKVSIDPVLQNLTYKVSDIFEVSKDKINKFDKAFKVMDELDQTIRYVYLQEAMKAS